MPTNLTPSEILTIVNQYIGVNSGYLADFTYRTFSEFFVEYCNLTIDPKQYSGTIRQRFISILSDAEPPTQALILRGILKKYPSGSIPLRTPERYEEINSLIARLEESASLVATLSPKASSDVVNRAISDAETLLQTNGATSSIDRMHTALHGHLENLCNSTGINHPTDASITSLYKLLRTQHPKMKNLGPHSEQIDQILKSFAAAIDSLNTLRNRASVAHPNPSLLPTEEARLYINTTRTLMVYLDSKFVQ